eukprot:6467397-Amphidinium_carterae.1
MIVLHVASNTILNHLSVGGITADIFNSVEQSTVSAIVSPVYSRKVLVPIMIRGTVAPDRRGRPEGDILPALACKTLLLDTQVGNETSVLYRISDLLD